MAPPKLPDDRRQVPRKVTDQIIEAYDLLRNELLGQVVNLNPDGLMLITSKPLESNFIFQLDLVLRCAGQPERRFGFGAESLWCSEANTSHHYWVGFRIVDVSLATHGFIESLTQSWGTEAD